MTDTKPSDDGTPTNEVSRAAPFSLTLDHPRLTSTDAESIRTFLRRYDQYCNEVQSRAQQATNSDDAKIVSPIAIKFCVDVDFLESSIALGFIDGAESYEKITSEQVRAFLDARATESKEVVTLDKLDKIIERELRTNMRNTNAAARMQDLFASYHTILSRNGLKWIITENQKVAVTHVLSAVRPLALKERLEADLSFSQHSLKKDFKGFLKHSIKLAEAFQIVDCGPPSRGPKADDPRKRSGNPTPPREPTRPPGDGRVGGPPDKEKDTRRPPVCLYGPHKAKGLRHFLKDCRECPEDAKAKLLQEHRDYLARAPASGTRSHGPPPKTGRLAQREADLSDTPSCPMTISDGHMSISCQGRCDDGSDDSIASASLAEKSVLKGIGRMEAIKQLSIQVALGKDKEAESFQFSRVWKVPRLVMDLSSGRLALTNLSFLVPDAELASEELLIGLPLLRHLNIDSRTLLERNRGTLDGTDCSAVNHDGLRKECGKLGRLILSRLSNAGCDTSPTDDRDQTDTASESQLGRSADRPRHNYYSSRLESDPFPDPNLIDTSLEKADKDSRQKDIDDMLHRAVDNGLPEEYHEDLRRLVLEFEATFDTGFSSTPSKVSPLRIRLTDDARPVRVRLRNYSPSQREFIRNLMTELRDHGIVYPNPTSAWACAPLLVPKAGPALWRFTVDLGPVNKYTKACQFPMPNVEQELTKTSGSKVFAGVDFTHSYWQLALHKESQECQSILTPDGLFSPTRVLHGTTNAVLHLQSFLSNELPERLKERVLLWVDDCLFHEQELPVLLENLRQFFQFCVHWNWTLNPRKCNLFATSAKWCGRIISAKGIRHDPSNLEGLTTLDCPTTGGQLQQFLCAMQWLRVAIPCFQELTTDLHEFLEKLYTHTGKRTKRAVARLMLVNFGWTDHLSACFRQCRDAIVNRITLSHRDESKRLCIYTDASDTHWSGLVTQVPPFDVNKRHADQAHEPLAFHSGRFSDTEMGWTTIEKEAYAILATTEKSHWLATCADGFDLFTDHNNLVFLFDPLSIMPDINQPTTRKVLRWAVRLSAYNYICHHIPGEDNVWTDLVSRWAIPMTIRRLVTIPPLPTTFTDFEWPSFESIRKSQDTHSDSRPAETELQSGVYRSRSGEIWVPDDDDDLQLRLCTIAHTGPAGHRGTDATEAALKHNFFWSTLSADVKLFSRTCIHCISTTGGSKVPRPFGPALHGTMPNDLVQFDYIEMTTTTSGDKYALMLRDDHSGYCWLYPATTTDSATAADALLDWSAAFGAPVGLMSDGPTHFRNETIRLLAKNLRSRHHFTHPYCPWANGAVERLGKELLRVARAVLSESQLPHADWPDLLPLFQAAINMSPSPQRGNVPPITAFTGLPATPPIATFLSSYDQTLATVDEAGLESAINISDLVQHMDDLHPKIQATLTSSRERQRKAQSKGKLPNFVEGDFVLVAREEFFEGEKLCLRWRGPRRVTKVLSDYVFTVEDLRNGQTQDIHGSRLKFYCDASLNTTAIMSHVLASETGMPVSRLLRLEKTDGQFYVVVRWKGLSHADDTAEPLQRVFEDVPQLVSKLLSRKATPEDYRVEAMALLGL